MRTLPIVTAALAATAMLATGPEIAEYPEREITMIVSSWC